MSRAIWTFSLNSWLPPVMMCHCHPLYVLSALAAASQGYLLYHFEKICG